MTDLVKWLKTMSLGCGLAPHEHTLLREAADEIADLKRRLAEAESTLAGLDLLQERFDKACENGLRWKDERDEACAEAAALREALQFYADGNHFWTDYGYDSERGEEVSQTFISDEGEKASEALSQPGPGAAFLDRMRKLEAVAEAALSLQRFFPLNCSRGLDDALAALKESP